MVMVFSGTHNATLVWLSAGLSTRLAAALTMLPNLADDLREPLTAQQHRCCGSESLKCTASYAFVCMASLHSGQFADSPGC